MVQVPGRWVPLLAMVVLARPPAVAGQDPCSTVTAPVAMEMLLEKTIFRVDVLTLSVVLGGEEADRLRAIREAPAPAGGGGNADDEVARVAIEATCADSEMDFLRHVSLDQLIDAIRKSSRAARDAGFIEADTYDVIDRSLPEWYAFLEGRGVRKGDRMSYTMRADTLVIRYHDADGDVLLDQTEIDRNRRRSVLAGYFAPGSDFRRGLIASFLDAPGETPEGSARSNGIAR